MSGLGIEPGPSRWEASTLAKSYWNSLLIAIQNIYMIPQQGKQSSQPISVTEMTVVIDGLEWMFNRILEDVLYSTELHIFRHIHKLIWNLGHNFGKRHKSCAQLKFATPSSGKFYRKPYSSMVFKIRSKNPRNKKI
jgi:hypothetical protein